MTKRLAGLWEHIFSAYIPDHLDGLVRDLGQVLRDFRRRMAKRPELKKAPSFALATQQVNILERSIKDTSDLNIVVSKGQKQASRLIVPFIVDGMTEASAFCVAESGEGNNPYWLVDHKI